MNRTLFTIDSSKRVSGTAGDFEYNFGCTLGTISKLNIISFDSTLLAYNINSYNNRINITYLGTTYTATIVSGIYSSYTTVGTALKFALDNCGAGLVFSVTLDPITTKTTITTSAIFTMTILSDETSKLLGFVKGTYSGALTYTGSNNFNIIYNDYIVVNLNQLGTSSRFRINVLPGNVFMWNSNYRVNVALSARSGLISTKVNTVDQWGRPVSDDFTMMIEIG
jgi:hypothetical protein